MTQQPDPRDELPGLLDRPAGLAAAFNRVADGYDARPGYPEWVFDLLADRCGLGPGVEVVEIGPGVGQATLPLVERGARVVAVEPGPALAERLDARTPDRSVRVVVSRFEDAALPAASFDLVVAATAFHWVEPIAGVDKAATLLHNDGWLALWWNIWGDDDRPDPFYDALHPVVLAKAPHLAGEESSTAAYRRDIAARMAAIERSDAFGPMREEVLQWEGRHDALALRQMFATFGGWISLDDALREELLDDVERIARDDFGGEVRRPYLTVIYMTQRLPRPRVAAL